MKYTLFAAAIAAAAMTMPAGAAQISSIANPTGVVTFDDYDAFITSGPETVAPGVTFSASLDSTLGADIAELEANGLWGAGKLFAALGSFGVDPETGSLSFTFASPVLQAGGFVNASTGSFEVSALDAMGMVLESHIVSVSTPNGFNDGVFAGIGRSTHDIKTLRFSGLGLVVDDVSYVPTPAAATLLLAGLLGASALRRRSTR
jgi:hypothetical protein